MGRNDFYEEEDNFTRSDDFGSSEGSGKTVDDYGSSFYDSESDTPPTDDLKKKKALAFVVMKKGRRKGERFDLDKNDVLVGRSSKICDVVIDEEEVSKIHCRIRKDEKDNFLLFDCGSTNGTKVNGQDTHFAELKSNDVITLGEYAELVFMEVKI